MSSKKFSNPYDAGYDAGLNGVNEENCNPFKWFNKPENTKEWERGNKDGGDRRELDSQSMRKGMGIKKKKKDFKTMYPRNLLTKQNKKPMTLLESINKRAEEKYPEFSGTSNEAAYISGCKDQHELMIEFLEYFNQDKWDFGIDPNTWKNIETKEILTTEQLFEYFINNVKQVL